MLWVILHWLWPKWKEALIIVQPDTVIRWHRDGFRRYWRWKPRRGRVGRPRIEAEIRDLVRPLASENPTYVKRAGMWSWEGHARSCAELLALSFT